MSVIGLALLAAAMVSEPTVTSATGDWSNIPMVAQRGNADGTPYVLDELERIARSRECVIEGVTRRRIRLDVPFLIRFDPTGKVTEVVVRKMNCPAAETALASTVKLLAEKGEYRPAGTNAAGWYRGAFNVESVHY